MVQRLLGEHGQTFAEQAGITLADRPSPLYRLLVLSVLLSAPIPADTAVAAAVELSRAGLRSPRAMRDAEWARRVELLGRAGYRRFDERTATLLGTGADVVLDRWRGDLRRLHEEHVADAEGLRRQLQKLPGIGPVGSAIFCREVQVVWPDLAPFVDERVRDGARALGLPTSPAGLARLVPPTELPRLAAACVRATLDPRVVESVQEVGAGA
jgi:hypothetical protein